MEGMFLDATRRFITAIVDDNTTVNARKPRYKASYMRKYNTGNRIPRRCLTYNEIMAGANLLNTQCTPAMWPFGQEITDPVKDRPLRVLMIVITDREIRFLEVVLMNDDHLCFILHFAESILEPWPQEWWYRLVGLALGKPKP